MSAKRRGDYFALVEEAVNGSLRAAQDPEEFGAFLEWLLSLQKLRYVLEIGTYFGGTTWTLAQVAEDDAVIVSVDIDHSSVVRPSNDQIARCENQTVYLLSGDSHAELTVSAVKECLGDNLVDLLFIDADHTYEAVRLDWELYTPFVRPDGVVALHDAVDWGATQGRDEIQVWKFWAELEEKYPGATRLFAVRSDTAGIGVVELPEGGET